MNGTEFAERIAQAVYQGGVIAAGDNHAATEVYDMLGLLRRGGGRAPPLSILPCSVRDAARGLLKERMIEVKWYSIAQREIGGANEKEIESRHSRNLIDGFDGLTILDLKGQEYFFIRMLQVLMCIGKTKIRIGASAIEAALSNWGEARPLDPLPCLPGASNVRNHQSVGAEFKRLHGTEVAALYDAHH